MNRITRIRFAAMVAMPLVAALGLASPQSAAAAQIPTARVEIADLDLNTPNGQERLQLRIRAAIDKVCVRPASLVARSLQTISSIDSCKAAANTSVKQQLARLGLRNEAVALSR
jgi:UrcA family protein